MRVFIVEDEDHSRKTLVNFLNKYVENIDIVGYSALVSESIELINKKKPELIFLDIDLPDGNGFEVLDALQEVIPKVIFVTAYNQYAIKAFQVSAIDYLLKPIDPALLKNAVAKARESSNTAYEMNIKKDTLNSNNGKTLKKLSLPTQNGIQMVKISDIKRIEADGNYARIFTNNGKSIFISKSLKIFDGWLEGLSFYRVHHSHIINLNCIEKYIKGEGGTVVLDNGDHVEVSRRRKDEFLKRLNN